MGTAGRITHHVLVSRRRTHRRRPTLRRAPQWPAPIEVHEAVTDNLTSLSAAQLSPALSLSSMAGKVNVATIIDADVTVAAHEPSVLDMPLSTLNWSDPFHWLALGWRDFARTPLIGLLYGACFVAMGWMLLGVFEFAPEYTLALSAGFLLMGPFLCLGLYQVSRSLEQGRKPRLLSSLTAWRFGSGQLAVFACVLLVLEMLWGRSAMIVFAISFDGMPDFGAPLATLLTEEYLVFFAAYGAVAAIFSGLIYAISVISMPMIMDRSVDAISAGLTSLRLVSTQTGVMLLWATLITSLIVLAMLPGFVGLLVVGPVLGHASWHAYRAATTFKAGGLEVT